jgi:hypothetical protein
MIRVLLKDGSEATIPDSILTDFVGLSADGYAVVRHPHDPTWTYGLTLCCFATAKGSVAGYYGEPAVVCRSCYNLVDDMLGGPMGPAPGKEAA